MAERKRKPKLPRAPLPKQKGGPHKTSKVLPFRKRKHKETPLHKYGVGEFDADYGKG